MNDAQAKRFHQHPILPAQAFLSHQDGGQVAGGSLLPIGQSLDAGRPNLAVAKYAEQIDIDPMRGSSPPAKMVKVALMWARSILAWARRFS